MLQVVGAVGFMDHRLDIPSDVDPHWASMIESCWDRCTYYIYFFDISTYYLFANSEETTVLNVKQLILVFNKPILSASSDPQRRPSFQELLDQLRDLQKQYNLQAQLQRTAAAKMSVDDC